ncbi:NYN domain-containing protein [Sutterella sp.]|uniref:NYN domain-containing protein n=1 Tax=Sutterella sp. TaxID=1981025 RepID=UPI0026E04277|nr:NYN domain-containing protein [Sutterella sp.]MDO5531825.1 NYN domain-containing protein [Sutterella sp.]
MDELKKIAVLIDADNTPARVIRNTLDEIATYGRVVVKRAYGNWSKPNLASWLPVLNDLAIKAEQQTDYVTGKNTSDIALIIDAMDLLYTGLYDAFVIVSSDSDFTPLALRLHESGVMVIGVGETKTPVPFRNACDEFVIIENIGRSNSYGSSSSRSSGEPEPMASKAEFKELHALLAKAWYTYEEEGYCNVCSANTYLRRAKPDFDCRTYGATSLPRLLERFPHLYRVDRFAGRGGVTIVAYRCLNPSPAALRELQEGY